MMLAIVGIALVTLGSTGWACSIGFCQRADQQAIALVGGVLAVVSIVRVLRGWRGHPIAGSE
jgi:hypothetical protein